MITLLGSFACLLSSLFWLKKNKNTTSVFFVTSYWTALSSGLIYFSNSPMVLYAIGMGSAGLFGSLFCYKAYKNKKINEQYVENTTVVKVIPKKSIKEDIEQSSVALLPVEQKVFDKKDLEKISEICSNINLNDSSFITNYGLDAQKQFSAINEKFISVIKQSTSVKMTTKLNELIQEVNKFSIQGEDNIESIMKRIDELSEELLADQSSVESYVSSLDSLLIESNTLSKGLDTLIAAGRKSLEDENAELSKLQDAYNKEQDMLIFNQINDFKQNTARFQKRISSLHLTRNGIIQFCVEIGTIKNTERHFIDDVNSVMHNIIPSWKSKINIAINNKKMSYKDINDGIKAAMSEDEEGYSEGILDDEIIKTMNDLMKTRLNNLVRSSKESNDAYREIFKTL